MAATAATTTSPATTTITKTTKREKIPLTDIIISFLSFLLLTSPAANAYGVGASYKSCDTLEPEHYGASAKDPNITPNPYILEVINGAVLSESGRILYRPGDLVTFRLAGERFRGFMFQVMDEISRTRGRFVYVPEVAKTMNCKHDHDTITHNSALVKEELYFFWQAPDNERIRRLFLRGSVVRSEMIYWMDFQIELINHLYLHEYEVPKLGSSAGVGYFSSSSEILVKFFVKILDLPTSL
ncbi:hypothetical protein HELRODRAFT_188155 [Helobdella robusta]|uniref:Reelin domain-containing protein n=1 Tax=Helobdella robusta TaxID=6412 RepID=T1FPP9_HELRO|nr:hypothetical protein HELRODRAFT_188155 [Helobdella robusta]ESO13202.1 hypothetical protein HELRODRAFT_188155 [Helobdella robusta]